MKSTRFICARIMALLLLMITSVISKAQTTLVDEMPYTYDVTSTGAFTYSLPIRIPPGIKDMMPELAITYNSQGGNGTMGMGWSLTGLSSITRAQPTLYHHSELKKIEFSNTDNFVLDGMPLYKDATTGYYMTWIKNYAKIQAHFPSANGPQYWSVENTDGRIYEYGNSPTSYLYATGRSEAMMYGINKISDKYGNYMDFEYNNSLSANGTYVISKIRYTANASTSTAPGTEIFFNYATKAESNTHWVTGSQLKDNVSLSSIEIKQNGVLVNKYEFTYAVNDYTHLTKIEEKRGAYTVPPINITWYADPTAAEEVVTGQTNTIPSNYMTLDYNGDGFSDYIRSDNVSSSFDLFTNQKNNTFSKQTITMPYSGESFFVGSALQQTIDYNGDGLDDIISVVEVEHTYLDDYEKKVYYFQSTGTSFSPGVLIFSYRYTEPGNAHPWTYNMRVFPGDFDGDGKTELFIKVPSSVSSSGSPFSWFTYVIDQSYSYQSQALPGSTFGSIQGNYIFSGNKIGEPIMETVLDFNGDGKHDLFTSIDGTGAVSSVETISFAYTGTGNSITMDPLTAPSVYPLWLGSHPSIDYKTAYPGDFNGDGKGDLLVWKNGEWGIMFSKHNDLADGFESLYLPAGLLDGYELHSINSYKVNVKVADFNGDGKTDILRLENSHYTGPGSSGPTGPVSYKIFYSTGYNTFRLETGTDVFNYITSQKGYSDIGDFNGDGQADVLSHWGGSTSGTPGIAYFSKNDMRHIVKSIEHAGKTLRIGITALPQWSWYTQKAVSPASYPYVRRKLPIKVVAAFTDGNINNRIWYEDLVMHTLGLGLTGFSRMCTHYDNTTSYVRENIYANASDAQSPMPFIKEWREWDNIDFNDYYHMGVPISFPTLSPMAMGGTTYDNNNGGCAGRVRMITLNNTTDFQLHSGIYKTSTPSYSTTVGSVGFEYGKPDVEVFTNGPCTTTINYTYNLTAPLHYAAKPVICTTSTQRFSQLAYTRISNYQYNAQGQLSTFTTDPTTSNERVVQYTYDGWGNLASDITTATGVTGAISHSYNATPDGRFTERSFNPFNAPSEFTYNIWGKVLTENGPFNNDDITYEYNAFNRLTKKTDVSTGIYTTYDFGLAAGMPDAPSLPTHLAKYYASTSTIGISGTNIDFFDDDMRKLRSVTTGYQGQKLYQDNIYLFDHLYQETNMFDPADLTTKILTTHKWGKWFREEETYTSPASQHVYKSYTFYPTPIPRLETTISTISGASKVITTDESGAVMKIVDNGGNTIEFDYHSNGQLERQKMNGNAALQTFNQYDNYGHLTQSTEPNGGTTTYVTNALDQVTSKTDALGNVYTYTYDNLGRITTMGEKAAGSSSVFFYNNIYDNLPGSPQYGKLLQKTSPHGTNLNYGYDPEGNVSNITENENGTIFGTQYLYDVYGRVQQQTYPSGVVTTNDYNSYGYLESVNMINGGPGLAGQKLWTANTINHSGQTTQATYYDAFSNPLYTMDHTYTDLGHPLTTQLTSVLTPTPLIDVSYDFDPVTGNLNERNDDIRGLTDNFTYDIEFDRLKTVTGPVPPTVQIEYSAEGNIKKRKDVSNNNYSWAYNGYAIRQVARLGATNFAIPLPDQIETYYPFKKVKTLEESNEVHAFNYWPDWQRSKMTITNKSTSTLLSTKYYSTNTERIIDAATGNQEDNTYIFANGECIAIVQHKSTAPPKLYFPMTDYLGSITHIFDNVGLVNDGLVEERSFDAWGRPRNPNTWVAYATTAMPTWKFARGYTGHEHLLNKNIINMNGRLYDPLVGRMLSPDPVLIDVTNSQAYNKYSYALNNPFKYTDPSGNTVVGAIIVGAVIGAYLGGVIANNSYHPAQWNFSSGTTWGYMAGGAVVGGLSGYVGVTVAASGIPMANTAGIASASFINSVGTAVYTGGKTDVSVSVGIASYNFSKNKFGYLGKRGNSAMENIAYGFGALANLGDGVSLFSGGGQNISANSAEVTKEDWWGHHSLTDANNNKLVSVGPMDGVEVTDPISGNKHSIGQIYKNSIKGADLNWETYIDPQKYPGTWKVPLYNVSSRAMQNYTSTRWDLLLYSCTSHSAKALWLAGVPNLFGFHPHLLNAQLWTRMIGIYSSPYLYQMP